MIWDNIQQKRYYLQQPFFTADVNEIVKSIKHFHAILLPEVVIIAHLRYAETWWRHQMEAFSALLAICAGNSPVPVKSPHKGQWRGALMFSLICARINDWVNNQEAGDLRRHRGHYDVSVMNLIFQCRSTIPDLQTDL